MAQKRPFNFFFWLSIILLGRGLFKLIDFEMMEVRKPALAAVYALGLLVAAFLIIKRKNLEE